MSVFTLATILEISSDFCRCAYKFMMPVQSASTFDLMSQNLPFDLTSSNILTNFPLVVAGLLMSLCFLGVAGVFHFTIEKLATCTWKIIVRLTLMLLEFWKLLLNLFNHVGELIPEIAELLGVVLVIVVILHILFLFYGVHLFSQLHPDKVVEIWLSFAFMYTAIMIKVVTCLQSDWGMYVLTKILNVIFPELLTFNLLNLQAPTPQPT